MDFLTRAHACSVTVSYQRHNDTVPRTYAKVRDKAVAMDIARCLLETGKAVIVWVETAEMTADNTIQILTEATLAGEAL